MAIIANNSISSTDVQAENGIVSPATVAQPITSASTFTAPAPAQLTPQQQLVQNANIPAGQPGSPWTVAPVVTANKAVDDLAGKNTFLNNTTAGMTAQASANAVNTSTQNATNTTQNATPTDNTANALSAATTALNDATSTPLKAAIKTAQDLGYTSPADIANYLNTHDAGQDTTVPYTDKQVDSILNPPKVLTPEQQAADIAKKQDDAYALLQTQTQQILNGTFPLTPDQLAQVNALQQQFEQLKVQQKLANQNYEGGVTNAGIASGRNRYAPEIELGNIQAAVSAGIQKIAEIDAKAASSIAALKQGFMDKDYDMINKSFDQATKYFQQKSDALNKMTDNVRENAKLALDQHKSAMDDQKQESDKQQAAIKFALDQQVTKPFYLVGNTAVDTATGEKVSLAEYQRRTGQKVGLPEDQTDFSHIQTGLKTPADRALDSNKFVSAGTDINGNPVALNTKTGQFTTSGGAVVPPKNTPNTPNANGITYQQYGLLANTDFNPSNPADNAANLYLDRYLKSGTEPSARALGLSTKANMGVIAQRANDLYFAATGEPLPTPQILKKYTDLYGKNLDLANNLKIQEGTVMKNVDLSLNNITKNDLNSVGFKPLDSFINSVNDMFNDPATGQLIAQNTTIQNELGSLLAVKNASGTTVHDKLVSAGIITNADSSEQIKTKVGALLQEAANFADSINSSNADILKHLDPLEQNPDNPARTQHQVANPTSLHDLVQDPAMAEKALQVHKEFPKYSDDEIFQILNGTTNNTPTDSSGRPTVNINSAFNSGGLSLDNGGSVPNNAQAFSGYSGSKGSLASTNPNPRGVIAGYDINSYATDPNHEANVKAIYNRIPTIASATDADSYIRQVAKGSPVSGLDVMTAAQKFKVDPKLILAIMQQDSTFGTKGKAVYTKNPGNVGNTDSGATRSHNSWTDGVLAVAQNLSKRKIGGRNTNNIG